MDHASFWLKTGTPHLPKWYMLLTEVVYTAYRNGTLSLPKTGTLLGTDYKDSLLLHFITFVPPMQEVATHTDYKALYEESQRAITQLRHELDQLKKMIFGSRQERFIPGQSTDSTQLSMGLPAEQVAATSLIKAKKIEYTRVGSVPANPVTTHQGRMKLPDHLERKEILVDVAGKEGCREIGREITEELEYEPGRLYVNRYIRPKYASADNHFP